MRLWHYKLLPYLSNKHLLGQHRECCALRGKGWGKKHSVVDYVFKHDIDMLVHYHMQVMHEMHNRGYKVDINWWHPQYRGKNVVCAVVPGYPLKATNYPEHNDEYLQECVNLIVKKNLDEDEVVKCLAFYSAYIDERNLLWEI